MCMLRTMLEVYVCIAVQKPVLKEDVKYLRRMGWLVTDFYLRSYWDEFVRILPL